MSNYSLLMGNFHNVKETKDKQTYKDAEREKEKVSVLRHETS